MPNVNPVSIMQILKLIISLTKLYKVTVGNLFEIVYGFFLGKYGPKTLALKIF